jgi:hypothetical protein
VPLFVVAFFFVTLVGDYTLTSAITDAIETAREGS